MTNPDCSSRGRHQFLLSIRRARRPDMADLRCRGPLKKIVATDRLDLVAMGRLR